MVRRTQDFHLLWLLLSLQFPSHPRHAVAVVTYNSLLLERFSCWTPIQGVFTRCYSHHHGYFLFLHLIICLNSVGDRDGEMGCEWMWMWMNPLKKNPFSRAMIPFLVFNSLLLPSLSPPLSLILSKLSLLTVLAQTIRPCIQILQLMSHDKHTFHPFSYIITFFIVKGSKISMIDIVMKIKN